MSVSFSVLSLNRISVWTFHQMVPLALVVPSTLLTMMDLGSFSRGNSRRQRRPISMKFLVAPQSTMLEINIVMSSSLFMLITYYSVMTDTNGCN